MNKILITVAAFSLGITSCTKWDEVESPEGLQVSTDKLTYTAGDTVRFKFSGNADNIVFWSGKPGQKYELRNRTIVEGNTIDAQFQKLLAVWGSR